MVSRCGFLFILLGIHYPSCTCELKSFISPEKSSVTMNSDVAPLLHFLYLLLIGHQNSYGVWCPYHLRFHVLLKPLIFFSRLYILQQMYIHSEIERKELQSLPHMHNLLFYQHPSPELYIC